MKINPTERFSSRVENYIKYRPSYPSGVVETLKSDCGMTANSKIADIGSGTGILTQLLLQNGSTVFAVEPNIDMRQAAERLIGNMPGFVGVNGTAEATTLKDQSVDFITAGQAFHWFDRTLTRQEFVRILRPAGWVALVWNDRETSTTPFLQEYEQLLKDFGTDYEQVNHAIQTDAEVIRSFFAPGEVQLKIFPNYQELNYDGLEGRLLSSSYAPDVGHPNHERMIAKLKKLYDHFQKDDRVMFAYKTELYYGQLQK